MEYKVEITKSNFRTMNVLAQKRVMNKSGLYRKYSIYNIVHWIFAGIAVAALIDFYKNTSCCNLMPLNIALISISFWVVLTFIIPKWFSSEFINNAVSESGTVLGKFNMKFDESGVEEIGNGFNAMHNWKCIDGVEIEDNCLFIFVDIAKAIIVPLDAIVGNQRQELIDYINQHINSEAKVNN